ncbi:MULTISPECIES: hypothetical protein [Pseudomonas]|uniref:hypothetical protein n=1 Tax=Pseudomonas TaxID=286 RepID=UPI001E4ABBAB|nr:MULTISPECIES: hypothetical protein [Pseudomonas]MCD5983165.1 hypothetical protein [Pseudomonas sp. CDFA 610]MCQ9469374.1 hypothetical protein [Pseudomonas alliivorans]
MTIENKNWKARDDRMPGVNTLKISGTVTVPTSNTTAVLVPNGRPRALSHLSLDLILETQGVDLQVLTEKEVVYTQRSGADITSVSIYYNNELLASIDGVEVTH